VKTFLASTERTLQWLSEAFSFELELMESFSGLLEKISKGFIKTKSEEDFYFMF